MIIRAEKYLNKYRSASARAAWWDYTQDAAYFITICTDGRQWYFGSIINGKMQPSPVGRIANMCWNDIIDHTQNTRLGEFVVMPNHVHGILILTGNTGYVVNQSFNAEARMLHPRFRNPGKNSVSSIVASFKSAVSKHAHRRGYSFAWQARFHDHIIRNAEEYRRITRYIRTNPSNWSTDRFRR